MERKTGQTRKTLRINIIQYTMKMFFTIILMAAMSANVAQNRDSGPEAQKRMAVVETSTCYMRLMPDYESALETQELMGTVVEIVGQKGYWREIVSPQPYKAWTTEKTLVEMTPEQIREYEDAPKYMFTGLYGHIYEEPGAKAATICDLVGGDVMRVVMKGAGESGERDGAGKKENDAGGRKVRPVVKGKWAKVMLPSGKTGWVLRKDVCPLGERIDIRMEDAAEGKVSREKMEDIITSARQLLGVPYLWGGMSAKGVDCSGLVRISCIMNGVLLPRNASQQIRCGKPVEVNADPAFWSEEARRDKEAFSREMKKRITSLKRGDLVFFGTPATAEKPMRVTHVGIYLGNGEIIHSSHLVRINSLDPGSDNYYENAHRLIGGCRLGDYWSSH